MLTIVRSLVFLCVLVSSCSLGASCGLISAQDTQQTAGDEPDVRQIRYGISGGIRKLKPGSWGLMRTEVSNPSNQDREALSVVFFDSDPGVQFGRRIWVPARSSRVFWIPVLVPEDVADGEQRSSEFYTANANIMAFDESGEEERVLRVEGEQLAIQVPFSVDTTGRPIIAMVSDGTNASEKVLANFTDDQVFEEVLTNMKVARKLGQSLPNVRDPRVPVVPGLIGSANQLIVRGDRLAKDIPGRTAIRQWVQQGGRLWVMLDTMDEETCQLLLGDAFDIEYVDQVGLVNFQTNLARVSLDPNQAQKSNKLQPQEHDHPVNFVRAIVDDCETIATINGWPAIFKKDFGRGTIVFTTIGHRAFVREKRQGERLRGMEGLALLPRAELNVVSDLLFSEEGPPVVSAATFEPLIERGVGYQVPGRGLILVVLFGFCIGLSLLGVWLSKVNRMGHLIWIVPAATALAALPLVAVGNATQQAIPPTAVEAQFIEVPPSSDDLAVTGLAGVYDNQSGPREFASRSTSLFFPDRTGVNGTWRMVWEDLDSWQWENVSLPSGLRHVPFTSTIHSTDPYRAYGTFGPDGFYGELECPLDNVRDVIIASSTHVSLAIEQDDGKLKEAAGGTLDPGNYLAGGLLTDEQISHQKVFRNIMDFGLGRGINVETDVDADPSELTKVPATKFPKQPSLMAWADPVDAGFAFGEKMQQKGAALVVMPIQLRRPEAGQRVRIPSVFLPYGPVPGPNDEGVSVAYLPDLGIWPKRSLGTKSTVRFQLPKCVLPFQPTAAKLRIKINAAKRAFNVKTGRVESLVDVGSTDEPLGVLTYRITDPNALALDEDGGLNVRISVGEPETGDTAEKREWKIDFVDLEIEGTYSPQN